MNEVAETIVMSSILTMLFFIFKVINASVYVTSNMLKYAYVIFNTLYN